MMGSNSHASPSLISPRPSFIRACHHSPLLVPHSPPTCLSLSSLLVLHSPLLIPYFHARPSLSSPRPSTPSPRPSLSSHQIHMKFTCSSLTLLSSSLSLLSSSLTLLSSSLSLLSLSLFAFSLWHFTRSSLPPFLLIPQMFISLSYSGARFFPLQRPTHVIVPLFPTNNTCGRSSPLGDTLHRFDLVSFPSKEIN